MSRDPRAAGGRLRRPKRPTPGAPTGSDQDRLSRQERRADWMTHLRVAIDDVEAVAIDMLRKPSARQLGPSKHRELYRDAASKLAFLLANPPPDPHEHDPEARRRAESLAPLRDLTRADTPAP